MDIVRYCTTTSVGIGITLQILSNSNENRKFERKKKCFVNAIFDIVAAVCDSVRSESLAYMCGI